jgi:hypothetical protein
MADATLKRKRPQSGRSETCAGVDSTELERKYGDLPSQSKAGEIEIPAEAAPSELVSTAQLFPSQAEEVCQIHNTLMREGRVMLTQMIRAGEILTQVKADLPHGGWMPWTARNLPQIHHRTLNRYMLSYRRRNDPLVQSDPARLLSEIHGHSDPDEGRLNSTSASNLGSSAESDVTESGGESPVPVAGLDTLSDLASGPGKASDALLLRKTPLVKAETAPLIQRQKTKQRAKQARTISADTAPASAISKLELPALSFDTKTELYGNFTDFLKKLQHKFPNLSPTQLGASFYDWTSYQDRINQKLLSTKN